MVSLLFGTGFAILKDLLGSLWDPDKDFEKNFAGFVEILEGLMGFVEGFLRFCGIEWDFFGSFEDSWDF